MPKTSKKKEASESWRASWKGEVRFGLVRFSVQAVNAHSRTGGDIHFNQLHAKCHNRIEYKKFCPTHGELEQEEIILGYEYTRGKYVEVDPDELDEFRTKEERALSLEEFIPKNELDQIHFDGRMYFIAPAEANDREPYDLLRRALTDEGQIGIGQVVFSGKEQLAAILPRDQILVMAMLNYASEIRDPKATGMQHAAKPVSSKNLRMAKDLIQSMVARNFSIATYTDRYRKRVMNLINSKRKGKEVVAPRDEEDSPVINLMEALKKSLPSSKPRAGKSSKSTTTRSTTSKSTTRRKKAV